jgi:carotenoid phi-ring synthase / carotenoid chi-ring synthase
MTIRKMTRRKWMGTAAFVGLATSAPFGCRSRTFQNSSDSTPRARANEFDGVTIAPENPNAPERLPSNKVKKVLVVGGGIAGLAAALELAEKGYKVTVREAAPHFGGRLHTRDEELPVGKFRVEHGLHMWFFQYYNFETLLQRFPMKEYKGQKDFPRFRDFKEVYFKFKDYKPELLKSEGPYPFNLLSIVLNSPNMNLLTAAGAAGALPELVGFNYDNIYERFDHLTFPKYVSNRKVNKDFYQIIMEPAASVTLNDKDKVSAAEMLVFTNLYFLGHPRAFHRKVTTVDHGTAIIDPWVEKIRSLGGELTTDAPVSGFVIENNRILGCVGETERFDECVLSCDIPGAQKILSGSKGQDAQSKVSLSRLQSIVAAMKVAPPYRVLRVWFDKPTDPRRPQYQSVIETSQFRPINLIGLFHMLEKECQDWAEANNGSILEYHLYNTPELEGLSKEEVWKRIEETAFAITPELQGAKTLALSMGAFHNFTSIEPGQALARPFSDAPRKSGIANLTLAGDWIRTKYPSALMERAVSTGIEAANHICLGDDVRQSALKVSKNRGPGLLPDFG